MANQVMEQDGSYFSVNPASRNMRELKPEELNDYLLNKRQLTPNDMERNDSGEVNIDYSNPNQSLYQKAMVDLASERGAVSGMKNVDGSRAMNFARTIELPSSTDIDMSSKSVSDFQAFTADQALKTQQIADNFEKYNSNATFDSESSANLLKDLNHEFASIDSSYLEKLHDASKSNLNFTGS